MLQLLSDVSIIPAIFFMRASLRVWSNVSTVKVSVSTSVCVPISDVVGFVAVGTWLTLSSATVSLAAIFRTASAYYVLLRVAVSITV